MKVIKKDGTEEEYNSDKVRKAVLKSSQRGWNSLQRERVQGKESLTNKL